MVKLGHAASKLAPFLAGGRVAALGELVADGRPAGAVQRMARRQGKPTPSPEAQPEAGTGLLATMGPGVGKPVADQRALGQLVGEAALNQVQGNVRRSEAGCRLREVRLPGGAPARPRPDTHWRADRRRVRARRAAVRPHRRPCCYGGIRAGERRLQRSDVGDRGHPDR